MNENNTIVPNYKSKFENSIQLFTKYPTVFIDICVKTFAYKVFEISPDGKFFCHRKTSGMPMKDGKGEARRNSFGKVMLKPFSSYVQGRNHAQKYVDEYLTLEYGDKEKQ